MEWSDNAIILSVAKYSEQAAVVSCLTEQHGLCKGFIKNYKSKTNNKGLFMGNLANVVWGARLANHLGTWKFTNYETISPYFFHDRKKIAALHSACSLVEITSAEHETQTELFLRLLHLLHILKNERNWLSSLVDFELFLLTNIGYGLDLNACAVTGQAHDLHYISPNSGKAVSVAAGQAYKDRLFKLPKFLIDSSIESASMDEMIYALNVTKFFFEKYIVSQSDLTIPKIRIMLQDILKD